MPDIEFVAIDEMSTEITQAEYSAILERFYEHGYENDVKRDSNGNAIDGDEYVLRGMKIINKAMFGV